MITTEEQEALGAFARLYGRTWRRELGRRWENGTLLLSQVSVSEAELACLVRLKSKLGPSGLRRYQVPAPVARSLSPRRVAPSPPRALRGRAEGR
jgi:hypothetical protein